MTTASAGRAIVRAWLGVSRARIGQRNTSKIVGHVAGCMAVVGSLGACPASAQPVSIETHADPATRLGHLAQAAGPTLPGGASTIQESFQDWSVVCAQQATGKRCSISQLQADPQSRQRVLAIEITAVSPDKAEGILVLPFGLALDPGVTLQVDDAAPGAPLRYRTCLPAGCIVPITLDPRMLASLRKSTALKVKATADTTAPTAFSISLKGFGGAFDRILALAK